LRFLLDTNTCIRYLNGRAPTILTHLAAVPLAEIAVCAPVKAELYYGAARSQNPARSLARQEAFLRVFVSLAFDDHAARFYGRIRADLAARGTPIGANDLLIAAIALAAELTVVTHNTSEFGRISGLALEDWEPP
jgi:tRNA(fMet)-specific endonuclease VapC